MLEINARSLKQLKRLLQKIPVYFKCQTNLFLRIDVLVIINAANQYSKQNLSKKPDIFLAIPQRKDKFSSEP